MWKSLSKPLRTRDRIGAAVIGMGILMPVYNLTARAAAYGDRPTRELPIFIDELVGLYPTTMLIYGCLYLQIFAPLVLIESRRVLLRAGLTYTALVLAGVPFWLLWPVSVPRAPVPVTDLFTWGLALVRGLDPPTNSFPSLHGAESVLAALLVKRIDVRLGRVLMVTAVAIWGSTLTLDQHWFVDGLAGLLIAFTFERIAFAIRPLPASEFACGPRIRLLWTVGIYLVLFLICALPWWTGWMGAEDVVSVW